MARRPDELFDKIKIKKLCNDIQITDEQRNAAKEWLGLLEDNKLESEQQNRPKFEQIVLQPILGFTVYDFVPEKHDVDYTIFNRESGNSLCIEVKGTSTKNLFGSQVVDNKDKKIRKDETPVEQTWRYMGDGHNYGICTNYDDFVLLTISGRTKKVHKFNFRSIQDSKNHLNEDKLKEFIGIFSKDKIFVEGNVEKLTNESVIAEQEFTDEFYKLFHETRLMLYTEFSGLPDVSKDEAILWAQIYLNRLIFVFFVEDHNFIPDRLFAKRILSILKSPSISEHTKIISENINDLFKIMNNGSKIHGVNGFNGGLFEKEIPTKIFFSDVKDPQFFKDQRQNSKLSQKSLLVDIDINLSSQYADSLNPIIKNLLIMDSFDFTSDLNVNILGHIFEQSISDLESLHEEDNTKRKLDGVYYTSELLTDYICRNTIIPYLSKKGATSVSELVEEYANNIEKLEDKIRCLKILDPACGSGAFLVKAVDILLEIDEKIQFYKPKSTLAQRGLEEYSRVKEINLVVESNIFGVDINPESIEITKLSLFLKLAGPNTKLTYLSNNIKLGNSLIDDKTVDEQAFCWSDEFPEILGHLIDDKGFDIVIGNPPWQILKPDVDEFFSYLYESDDITQKFSKLTKIKKNAFIKKCLDDKKINNEWTEYQNNYKKQMDFFNKSENFEYQISKSGEKSTSSDINLYKLFIEKSYKLLKSHGYCGLIVPSGFYSDLGSKGLRELLLKKNRLIHLFSFINRKGIFEDVHRQFKFCTFVFKKEGITEKFLASFYMQDVSQLEDYKKIAYDYDVNIIQSSSPNSFSLIECKNKSEFEIFLKLYKHPLLMSDKWNFTAKREFDMTNDSQLFHTANVGYPLYEGKMMNMFTHTFSEPRYWIDKDQGKDTLKKKELNRMKRVSKSHEILPQIDSNEYRLVWRSITNSTNERTLISTILPPNIFLGNSLNYLSPINFDGEKYVHPISYDETFFICGIFNSFPIDFILRHRVATNLNIFYLMELPIPRYDKNNKLHKKLFENTVKLICTTKEYLNLMKIMNVFDPVSEPEKRLGLESQNNALSAKIYGLEKNDLKFVLENFPIVDQKLKNLTLDEFDLIDYE